jgi:hypothetical protein
MLEILHSEISRNYSFYLKPSLQLLVQLLYIMSHFNFKLSCLWSYTNYSLFNLSGHISLGMNIPKYCFIFIKKILIVFISNCLFFKQDPINLDINHHMEQWTATRYVEYIKILINKYPKTFPVSWLKRVNKHIWIELKINEWTRKIKFY